VVSSSISFKDGNNNEYDKSPFDFWN